MRPAPPVTLYGQEKDAATSGLARMNMILHNNPTALIVQGNTLADPKFKDGDTLKTFDYVVANPPFSDKRWSTGLDPAERPVRALPAFGVPPPSRATTPTCCTSSARSRAPAKAPASCRTACCSGVTPKPTSARRSCAGYIKGIIGLPANLFYGTGIPACIVVIDKESAAARKGIFMIDASEGFMKDGPKNRLRAQDIHKIVDVFTRQLDVARYSRMVPRRGDREERLQPQPATLHR